MRSVAVRVSDSNYEVLTRKIGGARALGNIVRFWLAQLVRGLAPRFGGTHASNRKYSSSSVMDTVFENKTVGIFFIPTARKQVRYFPGILFSVIPENRAPVCILFRCSSVFHNTECQCKYRNCLGIISVLLTIASAVLHCTSSTATRMPLSAIFVGASVNMNTVDNMPLPVGRVCIDFAVHMRRRFFQK